MCVYLHILMSPTGQVMNDIAKENFFSYIHDDGRLYAPPKKNMNLETIRLGRDMHRILTTMKPHHQHLILCIKDTK